MKRLGRVLLAVLSVGLLMWACGGEEPATGPQEPSSGSVRIMAVPPERSAAATEPFQLKALRDSRGLGIAQRSEATLRLISNWPADTAWEKCQEQDGENCKEQGKTWTGEFYVTCLDGPGQCDPETFTWELQNPPPGTSVSFSPATTDMEERTTLSIEVDNDAETGVFDATVAAPPSPGTLNFKFHTLCSWGLGTCPRLEMRDLMEQSSVVNVSVVGEQSKLIGERMFLRVRHMAGTGQHTFEQEEQEWLIQWDGVGSAIYHYDIEATQLQLSPFPEGIGEQDTVRYYHPEPNQYVVWAAADLNYDNDEAEVGVLTKAVFNLAGPTNLSLTSQTDSLVYDTLPNDAVRSRFGRLPPPGITWTFSATAPATDNGYVAGTQTLTGHAWAMNRSGVKYIDYDMADNFLDGCSLYDTAARSSGGVYTWTSRDSPGATLGATDSAASMDSDFDMYFMYRPAGLYSIWVPIGRLDWFFRTSVARQGSPGVWQLLSADASLNSPSGGAHSAFPTWVGVYASSESCPNVPATLRQERPAAISRASGPRQGVSP